MKLLAKPFVIIGFKHVGKTVVGKALATKLNKVFIDLDDEIEKFYAEQFDRPFTCREIVKEFGETYFRQLETQILKKMIHTNNAIIALGGGTVMAEENREMLSGKEVIYLDAPSDAVFERNQNAGTPSFFDPETPFKINLLEIWNLRKPVYEKLAKFKILNDKPINDVVNAIINKLLEAKNEGSSNGKSKEART